MLRKECLCSWYLEVKSLPVLSYVRLPTIRAGKFVNPGLCEWIALVCVV